MKKQFIALTATAALVAGTGVALFASPAQADGPERHAYGQVGGASYDIEVEKEHRFKIDADINGVAKGSTWKMVVRHDGKKVGTRTSRAVRDDGRWEVEFREIRSANTPGADTFKVTLKRVGTSTKATRTMRFAS